MSKINSVDDFLNHQSGIERRGGKYMRSWKKNGKAPNGGALPVWLHTGQLPVSVWIHQFPRLVVTDKNGVVTKNFYMSDFVCWESEETLKRMYQRNPDGSREHPPERCPICKLLEMLHQSVEAGDISTFDEVFRFEGATDPKHNIVLHAGGMINAWRKDRMNDAEKAEMKQRGLYFSETWKENCTAKNNYVLCLVQQEDVGAGVQIDTEPGILGDKLKGMINDAIHSKGPLGNPYLNPYCIELVYDDTKEFKEKYHARPMERFPLTEQIKQLIYAEPPSLTHATSPFNGESMRAVMERHKMLDVPWDEVFDSPQPTSESEEDSFPNQPAPAGSVVTQAAPPGTEPCEKCQYPLRADQAKCPQCGTEYDILPDAQPQPAHTSTPAVAGPPVAPAPFVNPPPPPAPVMPAPMKAIGGKVRGGRPGTRGEAPRKPGEPA